jgi:hypothetical protein
MDDSHFFDMFLWMDGWMDDPHFGCKTKIALKKTHSACKLPTTKV